MASCIDRKLIELGGLNKLRNVQNFLGNKEQQSIQVKNKIIAKNLRIQRAVGEKWCDKCIWIYMQKHFTSSVWQRKILLFSIE